MSERDFVYFLQGFVELNGEVPTETQWQQIKDHLALVFNKVTPSYVNPLNQQYCSAPINLGVGSGGDAPELSGYFYAHSNVPYNNPNWEHQITC